MFAGVRCFFILTAKYAKAGKVFSIDINPEAIRYTQKNTKLNNVESLIKPVEGDSREIIERKLRNVADRALCLYLERHPSI